ncbi:universal stress protein [Lujinxingia vulgaris]|uniref:Universal stress protein n=1 Tax=Lujinxingia vulgaris TaxID=2600176 RepID=A0A5C6X4Q5_9DELT|nr:universal stress protein [Lujinxingia vulgaris]TXD31364.1 universal stress protein [Lujinxingia vulgaris]
MYRVEQVLVPLDFSNFSRSALALAKSLGGESPARVQLGHALEPMAPYMRRVLFPYAALGEDDRAFEAELVEEARAELERSFEIDDKLRRRLVSEPVVEIGPSRQVVSEWTSRFDVEAIVMGAYGESGLVSEGLGATARRVLQTSSRPVILVRQHDPRPQLKRIVVALDLEPTSAGVLEVALGMALQHGCELELLFVLPSPLAADSAGLLKSQVKFDERQARGRLKGKIEALFERTVEAVEVPFPQRDQARKLTDTTRVESGEPAAEIVRRAYESDADLVVIGARSSAGGGGLGTVAEAVARRASCHVMVVPPAAQTTPLTRDD